MSLNVIEIYYFYYLLLYSKSSKYTGIYWFWFEYLRIYRDQQAYCTYMSLYFFIMVVFNVHDVFEFNLYNMNPIITASYIIFWSRELISLFVTFLLVLIPYKMQYLSHIRYSIWLFFYTFGFICIYLVLGFFLLAFNFIYILLFLIYFIIMFNLFFRFFVETHNFLSYYFNFKVYNYPVISLILLNFFLSYYFINSNEIVTFSILINKFLAIPEVLAFDFFSYLLNIFPGFYIFKCFKLYVFINIIMFSFIFLFLKTQSPFP